MSTATSYQATYRSVAHVRSLLVFAIRYEDRAVEVDEKPPTLGRAALSSEHDVVVADIAVEEVVDIVEYLMYCDVRQRLHSIQGLVAQTPDTISKQMIKWSGLIADESIVLVEGICQKPVEPVKSVSQSDVEVLVSKVRRISLWPDTQRS